MTPELESSILLKDSFQPKGNNAIDKLASVDLDTFPCEKHLTLPIDECVSGKSAIPDAQSSMKEI